jgi:hypothetical protein
MTTSRKVLVGVAIAFAATLGFMVWYRIHYSMVPAREFEVNSSAAQEGVLIATQGSAFKDSIVSGVVAHLKTRKAYVKVIDVSALPSVHESEWNAIVVMHTTQIGKPQPDAQRFIAGAKNLRKVVVLSTSGAGTFKIEGIDAISAASQRLDVPKRVDEIDTRIDAILDADSSRHGQ